MNVEALEALGHMGGVALERSRAREALEVEAHSRRQAEERLRRLHDSTASLTGDALFLEVVRSLFKELGTRWVLLTQLDAPNDRAVPLAALGDGEPMDWPPYPLAGTPCREVVETAATER